MDNNVIPVVEELRRRLPLSNVIGEGHGDGNKMGRQHDGEAGEEDGKLFLKMDIFEGSNTLLQVYISMVRIKR